MRVTSLLAFLLLPVAALSAPQHFGAVIKSIEISGAPIEALTAIPLGPGNLLTASAIRASIQALYDTGQYASIAVDAEPSDDGTELTFIVVAPSFFSTIRIDPDDVFERPLSSYVDLPYGERFSGSRLDLIVESVRQQLLAEGFFQTSISPSVESVDETRLVEVSLSVGVTSQARMGEARIEGGEQTFTDIEMQEAFGIQSGSLFSLERMERGISDIRTEFAALGFLNTSVVLEQTYDESRNVVDAGILIEPGLFTLVQVRGHDMSNDEIRELVPMFEEGSIDPDLIEEGRTQILEKLRQDGFFDATATSDRFDAPLDNAVQINYIVDPGERHSIEDVRFEGNKFFEEAFLDGQIGISERRLFSQGVFTTDLLDQAAAIIVGLYQAAGFEDTRVESVYSIDQAAITVILKIEEGRRIPLTGVFFSGNTAMGDPEVAILASMLPGQIYTTSAIEDARRAITARYHARGYPDVQVEPVISRRTDGSGTDVSFRIDEGPAYQIGRILVAGHTRTQEKIVHRNSGLDEGTPYDPETILRAQQRLYATGLFSRVDIVTLERETPDKRDLLIQVEDAGPVLLTYGIGVQDREGPRGTIELSHRNLFGLDRSISFRVRGSKREQRFQTTYREPRLFNRELDGFVSLFVERTSQQFFDASQVDFSLQTLKRFRNQDSVLFSASFETVNLRNIRVNPRAQNFPDETGTIQIARLGASYIRDQRNDPISPSRGDFITGTFQVANRVLGSEVDFTSVFAQASFFRPAKEAVIAASIRLGWNQPYGGTKTIPITERYFAGGSTTLRSFGLDDAGPEGGGNALAIVNLEYRFPIPFLFSGLGGAAFYDTGTIFPRLSDFSFGDFTHTSGLGFRYETPLGPIIRVDFGFNLNRQPHESRDKVFFTLGHTF
jgi:outer membrane protein assembly complex protein YaeT